GGGRTGREARRASAGGNPPPAATGLESPLCPAPPLVPDPARGPHPHAREPPIAEAAHVETEQRCRAHLTVFRFEQRRDRIRCQPILRGIDRESFARNPSGAGFGGCPDVAAQIAP